MVPGCSACSLDPAPADHPVLAAATALAIELAESAGVHETDGVGRATVESVAAAGLYALTGPPELGGVPLPVFRQVAELLAGSSPDVWFVWFQHGPVVKMLAGSDNAELVAQCLAPLCSGEQMAGVAFSHLRSPAPSITAVREEAGWVLSGHQPWCTGWGIIDVVLVGAVSEQDGPDREVVFGLVPARDGDGLRNTGELPLAVMGGTSTVALALEDYRMRDEDVVIRMPFADWLAADRVATANVQPSTFGVALAAVDLVRQRYPEVADALAARILAARAEAYRLQDDVPPDEDIDQRLGVRARALLLGAEAATAAVAARGGAGMSLGEPAQRLVRAAAFQLVHAQTGAVRAATLDRLTAG